jgi:LPXTG-motif cell wall-anchored protein
MRRLPILVAACVVTAALAATPAVAGSTEPEQVPANVYFKDGDCGSLPTIDVESQEGVVYTLNGKILPKTKFTVPYGTSGTVIATAEEGFEIVGPSEFPFAFSFNQETCGGETTGGGTTGTGEVSGGGTGGTTGGTTGGVAGAQTGGELPFTGLPVWVPLLAGAALLSGGAVLLYRRRDELS